MKEIIVHSPKHGDKIALIDDEDFELISKYHWWRGGKNKMYPSTTLKDTRKSVMMHRMIMKFPLNIVDHIDGDTFNNQKNNLRSCSVRENSMNIITKRINNKSGYKGVHFSDRLNKYIAEISPNRNTVYLGLFDSSIEAAKAYNLAAKKYYGEFARLNEIPCAG
jgi:hypothetical protein